MGGRPSESVGGRACRHSIAPVILSGVTPSHAARGPGPWVGPGGGGSSTRAGATVPNRGTRQEAGRCLKKEIARSIPGQACLGEPRGNSAPENPRTARGLGAGWFC